MSISIPPSIPSPQVAPSAPPDSLWRLSVDQYHAMIRTGILTDGDPVELLEGLLFRKNAPDTAPDPLWPLSVDQYHAMIREGILTEDDPVELLEGLLVRKMSKNPPHAVATGLVQDALTAAIPTGWHVQMQDPVTTEDSEPEPDVKVVRGQRRDYLNRHPGPQDVALTVEVSDSSLQRDRGLKKRVYASTRIPVYWIVNLIDQRIEVYTDPSGPADKPDYRQRQDFARTDTIPVVIEGKVVAQLSVGELLP
jgi:Uma2 family endonuclease